MFLREHGVTDSYGDPLGIVLARLEAHVAATSVRALREIVRVPQRAAGIAWAALEALGLQDGSEGQQREQDP